MAQAIQKLPKIKRPREKLLYHGPQNLTRAELLAIILGSGTNRKNVLSLAKQVITLINQQLEKLTLKKLSHIHGIGEIQASKILATLELGKRFYQPQSLPKLLRPQDVLTEVKSIRTSRREQLLGLYLNARYELLAKEILAIGTLNTQLVEPRDVLAPALKLPCRSVILVHNHPSGNPQPSPDDIQTTQKLKKAMELLGIDLLDHLVVTQNSHSSFQEQQLL